MWANIFILFIMHTAAQVIATDYEIIGENLSFFEPCNETENVNIMDFFDFSQLKFTYDKDDADLVYSNGDIIVRGSIPKDLDIKADMEILQWSRGEWVQTVYTIRRDDFCDSLFKPTELWFIAMMAIPPEQRKCPPEKGDIYTLKNSTNKIVLPYMPHSDISGRYRAILNFAVGNMTSCVKAEMHVYRL